MSDNRKDEKLIVLSAGGTGGHLFPALALAQDLRSRRYRVALLTDTRGMAYRDRLPGIDFYAVDSATFGAGLMGKLKTFIRLGLGYFQARRLLRRLRPVVVVGFGGYPSLPPLVAAQRLKIPTVIHEQNAIIGRANAFLARRADRIALSLAGSRGLEDVDAARQVVTGNPVRAEISALYTRPYPALDHDGALRVLIMGGSLGARVFSDIVPAALEMLEPSYRARLDIVQQVRADDLEKTREIYARAGIRATLHPFIEDVPAELERAHLVIARSGASTVAEVTTAGRPAIFVPYPHHADQQQKINADAVAGAGGAWVIVESGFTAEALLSRLEVFMQSPEILFQAAEASRSCGKPDAARKLGNLVTAMASGWDK